MCDLAEWAAWEATLPGRLVRSSCVLVRNKGGGRVYEARRCDYAAPAGPALPAPCYPFGPAVALRMWRAHAEDAGRATAVVCAPAQLRAWLEAHMRARRPWGACLHELSETAFELADMRGGRWVRDTYHAVAAPADVFMLAPAPFRFVAVPGGVVLCPYRAWAALAAHMRVATRNSAS